MVQKLLVVILYLLYFNGERLQVVNGQPTAGYEAVELTEISPDMCTRDECEIRGSVETTHSSSRSTEDKVALYSIHSQSRTMEFLAEAPVTTESPHSEGWAVSFRLQGAQSLVLFHIRLITSQREVRLIPNDRKNTTKFLLGANPCHLCKSNASVLVNRTAIIINLNTVTPASGTNFTSRCSGRLPGPCPMSSSADSVSPTSTIASSTVNSAPSSTVVPRETPTSSTLDHNGSGIQTCINSPITVITAATSTLAVVFYIMSV